MYTFSFRLSLTGVHCSLEYWSLRGFPGQMNRLAALESAGYLPRVPSGSTNTSNHFPSLIAAAPFSFIYPRGSTRKLRHETIDTVREELQVLREEIARTLSNLQRHSEALLATNMEGTATATFGLYVEDPMVGSSRMAIPQGLGQATPGTSSPSAHSERGALLQF